MADTPQYGTVIFIGLRTRQTYSKDIYLPDSDGGLIRWDGGNGASSTSPQEWIPPEPVVMRDYSQVTGTVTTSKLQLVINGKPTGDFFRYVIHLTSLNNRPQLSIVIGKGSRISALMRV